ncbi:MAG: chemotaxis protein CheD [Chitinivibrionales bacterium]|nr:chemotaxis protein CheD [Chitinivibrionales bacterium]MBD3358669.1 chemotaxis protein CheD [Chitinivibrionales bacterium]
MRHIVGVSDMKLCRESGDVLVTHALGSCVGIGIYDPVARVGGLLHFMLPTSSVDEAKGRANPCMFGDTGIPFLFREAYKYGAVKDRLRVVMAGGAQVFENKDFFAIGKRNVVIARKVFWKNNVLLAAENVGGNIPRTFYLEIDTGRTWITSSGRKMEL